MAPPPLRIDPALRRPMHRVARVTLYEREVRERLSQAAVELLITRAAVLSEGECARVAGAISSEGITRGGRRSLYFGSTMLTLDLVEVSELVRDPCDPATARKVAGLLETDPRVARRAREIAEREAGRLAGAPVKTAACDMRVRAQGTLVHIDVDVEAEVELGPRAVEAG